MSLNKKMCPWIFGFTVLFLTISLSSLLRMQLTTGLAPEDTVATSTYASPEERWEYETKKEDTFIEETSYAESEALEEADLSAREETESTAETAVSDSYETSLQSWADAESEALFRNERTVRLCRILFPVTLLLSLAGLYVLCAYFKRTAVPEGLEVNLFFFSLAGGLLYMLLYRFSAQRDLFRAYLRMGEVYDMDFRSLLRISFRWVHIILCAMLSIFFTWSIRSYVSWILSGCKPSFSLLFRKTEKLRERPEGISRMLFWPLSCTIAGTLLSVGMLYLSGRDTVRESLYGVSGLMVSLSIMFLLLAALSFWVLLLRLRDVRAIEAEMVEKARVSERYRVDLVTNVSHDLRTPLTSIIGYGELLRTEPLSEKGRANLDKLNQKSAYLRDMVDAVFALSKVQSGAVSCRQDPIDLIRLLEQTLGEYDEAIRAAGLTVVRHYEAPSAPLLSDGIFLNQVFANLLSNAVKYTLAGTRIHVEVTSQEGGYQVRVMNVASYEMKFKAEEILERFTRGDESRSTEGSGLGLAIAKTYTEALHGTFRVEIDGDLFTAIVLLPKEIAGKKNAEAAPER